MTGAELGYLLLGSHLGDPTRKPMTSAQINRLRQRARKFDMLKNGPDAQVDEPCLRELGYSPSDCAHILSLLAQEDQAMAYLESAERNGLHCITRCSADYPPALKNASGYAPPAVLWAKGDLDVLSSPSISLVGSRDAERENLIFAHAVGLAAARQNLTLVSGGAKGADTAGQFACRNAHGKVICVVPDELTAHQVYGKDMLYLCEDSFDLRFTFHRALSRNHIIHILGQVVFVAQCDTHGGTWSGTSANLKHGWSPVYFYQEGSSAAGMLTALGATAVGFAELEDIVELFAGQTSLFV